MPFGVLCGVCRSPKHRNSDQALGARKHDRRLWNVLGSCLDGRTVRPILRKRGIRPELLVELRLIFRFVATSEVVRV
jgi:hypothetical protein